MARSKWAKVTIVVSYRDDLDHYGTREPFQRDYDKGFGFIVLDEDENPEPPVGHYRRHQSAMFAAQNHAVALSRKLGYKPRIFDF